MQSGWGWGARDGRNSEKKGGKDTFFGQKAKIIKQSLPFLSF